MRKFGIIHLLVAAVVLTGLVACFDSNDVGPIVWPSNVSGSSSSHSVGGAIVSAGESAPATTRQVMVSGDIQADGFAGGPITIEVREAEACAEGYCPIDGKAPLASTVIQSPGFFSIIVPSQGQKATLVVQGAGKSGMHYLGELSARTDGITVSLK